jgi:hypothetical protein
MFTCPPVYLFRLSYLHWYLANIFSVSTSFDAGVGSSRVIGLRFVLGLQIFSAHDGICYIRDFRLFLVIDTAMMGCRIEHCMT